MAVGLPWSDTIVCVAATAPGTPQVATALFDYAAQNSEEVSIKQDDKVLILDGTGTPPVLHTRTRPTPVPGPAHDRSQANGR